MTFYLALLGKTPENQILVIIHLLYKLHIVLSNIYIQVAGIVIYSLNFPSLL